LSKSNEQSQQYDENKKIIINKTDSVRTYHFSGVQFTYSEEALQKMHANKHRTFDWEYHQEANN
jgi:hypothetical protein